MKRNSQLLRRALWVAAALNVGGAFLFAFPASSLGQLAGLPTVVPVAYRAFTALFILLFAGAYAWLANQPSINRPFVVFGAIGKASAFFVVLLLWLTAEASTRSVLAISGDLVLAGLFTWGLVAPGTEAEGDASASPEHT